MDKRKREETSKQEYVRDYFRSMLMLGVLKEVAVSFDADQATERRGVRESAIQPATTGIGSGLRLDGRPQSDQCEKKAAGERKTRSEQQTGEPSP